ncbi:NADPH dehydrogenase NamA [Paenibacillus sp.]|uniref:NADPH dehydrogenase NamA n=1 Tax=Paenibacillus sp. TaxID=58172 RepID=UPI00281254C5|nr:NADPH dehydrogenase NamA [Paenibacillus sp.]
METEATNNNEGGYQVSILFSPFTIRGMTLKNRIMMSPMGTVAADEHGCLSEWQFIHYGARAVGQAGLIIIEVTAVEERGADPGSLGLWNDSQMDKLSELIRIIKRQGAKVGVQLGHAGRKKETGLGLSSSGLPFRGRRTEALNVAGILEIVKAFGRAAYRAKQAGVDVIELHAAHGYLINDFLSPLTNVREDHYGGSHENRYRFLGEIIDSVREVWEGPLFVRVSANEYEEGGNGIEDHLIFASYMKKQGVDLIDASSGGVTDRKPEVFPGYQVRYAQAIRQQGQLPTAAVGLITTGKQAEDILREGSADLIAVGRALMRDPYWPRTAAEQLGETIPEPNSYRGLWFPRGYTEGG